MLTWMAYAAAVAGLVAGGGLALERICEALRRPRRFAWLAALTLALIVPVTATPPPTGDTIGPVAGMVPTPGAEVAGTASQPAPDRAPMDAAAATSPTRTDRGAALLWGVASLSMLTMLTWVILLSARARRGWKRQRIDGEEVYVSRDFGPGLVGVLRPVVVIPRWVLDRGPAVTGTVVRHEREHARARDHLTLLYAGLAAFAFPWSPAVWWMCHRLRAAVEIDCDHRVIGSGVPATEYGSLLLGIGATRPRRRVFALTLAGPETLLERRLRTMLAAGTGSERKRTTRTGVALLAGVAVAAMVVACEVSPPTAIGPTVSEVLDGGAAVEGNRVSGASVAEQVREMFRRSGWSPSSTLPSDVSSADPLVFVDGTVLDGGLDALAERDLPEVVGISHYSHDPDRFGEFAGHRVWGVVLINTLEGEERGEARWWPPVGSETGGEGS